MRLPSNAERDDRLRTLTDDVYHARTTLQAPRLDTPGHGRLAAAVAARRSPSDDERPRIALPRATLTWCGAGGADTLVEDPPALLKVSAPPPHPPDAARRLRDALPQERAAPARSETTELTRVAPRHLALVAALAAVGIAAGVVAGLLVRAF